MVPNNAKLVVAWVLLRLLPKGYTIVDPLGADQIRQLMAVDGIKRTYYHSCTRSCPFRNKDKSLVEPISCKLDENLQDRMFEGSPDIQKMEQIL